MGWALIKERVKKIRPFLKIGGDIRPPSGWPYR
jgi:hypothetical protein